MASLILTFVLLTSFSALAMVTYRTQDCPNEFQGHVKEIVSPVGEAGPFATKRVIFENTKTIRGEAREQVQLDVLENGPFTVGSGEEYRIQTRNGKLCWIEEI